MMGWVWISLISDDHQVLDRHLLGWFGLGWVSICLAWVHSLVLGQVESDLGSSYFGLFSSFGSD